MTRRQLEIITAQVEHTRRVGRALGRAVAQPLLIALEGELGSGKTAFVQGLAAGLEVPSRYVITSPTFTLVNEYPGRLPLYHVDLYRLEPGWEEDGIGLEEILSGEGVVAVEWAEKLPAEHLAAGLRVVFEVLDADRRRLTFSAAGQPGLSLLKAIENF